MRLRDLPLNDLNAATLWSRLGPETRELAARSMYADRSSRREADMAVAQALRFRETALRKLPVDTRVGHLLQRVHVDEALATSLLLALHLGNRRGLLAAFLDSLAIPHDEGVIDEEFDLVPPPPERLTVAIEGIYRDFDVGQADVYLATLLALDPDTWSGLIEAASRLDAS